jgi:GT2 family glycosyltransferase
MSGRTFVSILIPNRDRIDLLSRCVESILEKTTYKNYEVLVVESGSQPAAFRYYDEIEKHRKVRILSYPKGLNYSAVNNFGAKYARGDVLLFLNNDTEIIDPDWLEEMIRWAERKEIGVVGTKLVKRDGTIQHAGVIIGLTGFAGHIFAGLTEGHWGPFGSTEWYRNYLAVTGACLMVRRNVFQEVGGFREDFCYCGSDVEFCLRTKERGYRVVYTPFAKLLHNEAATRGGSIPNGDFQVSFQHCEQYLRNGDPYFNPNLSYWHTAPRLRVGKEQAPARRSFPSF